MEKESTNYRKLNLAIFIVISIFLTTIFMHASNATWWNSSFDFRKEINITNPGSTTLNNFPIFINVSYESNMQTDFDDIRFLVGNCGNSSAFELTYELEYSDSNHAVFWVNIPLLEPGNSQICMYYGNSVVTSTENPTGVWKSNYGIVYHMDPTGQDSTSNNRDRVSTVSAPTADNTYLGYGLAFDGNDAWSQSDLSYWEVEWFERSHEIVFETSSDVTTRQTLFAEGGGTNGILMYIYNGQLYARWWSESAPNWGGNHFNTSISTNTVYHAVMHLTETEDYGLYLNGVHVANLSTPDHMDAHSGNGGIAYTNTAKDFHDGSYNGVYFKGSIHELRLYDIKESDDWVNMSAQNIINHEDTVKYNSEEINSEIFSVNINDPSPAAIYPIKNNKMFVLNTTLSCNSNIFNCGNITANAQFNISSATFDNISTSPTNPTWTTSLNPQSCILDAGESCDLLWTLNMSGFVGEKTELRINTTSNQSELSQKITDILTTEIVASAAIIFNQTEITIPTYTKTFGPSSINASVISTIGNNTDVTVTCSSGDCGIITENWIDTTDLPVNTSQNLTFSCDSSDKGEFWAVFIVTSIEDIIPSPINVSCTVLPIYGPISVNITSPQIETTTEVNHDKLIQINASMNCVGECGNISAYAVSDNAFGDGSDGNIIINSMNSVVNNYTYLTGDENSGDNIITVNDASEFNIGDEILIIQMQNGSGNGQAGNYEFKTILDKTGNDLTLNLELTNTYGSGTFDQVSASVTQIIRVPQFINVNIESTGSITAPAWDGYSGGIVIFRATGIINTTGYINVSNKGFRGGDCNGCGDSSWGDQGEGYLGTGIGSLSANGNGGGGGYGPTGYNGEPGAGGGYGTIGQDGVSSFTSIGGSTIGDANLTKIFLGGGAGGGGDDDNPAIKAQNVDGAGTVLIFGKKIINANIHANGENGVGNGGSAGTTGGGAGGAIWLSAESISINNVSAKGGLGFIDSDDTGGDGGDGRIRLDYITKTGNSTTPSEEFTGSINDFYSIISTISTTPLWTTSAQPQSCVPIEDGSCNFTWIINATGEINSNYSIKITILSNLTQINSNMSNQTTIKIINDIPIVTLINPFNGYKVISNGSLLFEWNITDNDDKDLICSLFIDSIFQINTSCYNNTQNSLVRNISSFGLHNWSIEVYDTRAGNDNSTIWNFTTIKERWKSISKSITNTGSNLYLIRTTITNKLNYSEDFIPLEFVHNTTNAGSFTPLYDFINTTIINPFKGKIYGWDLTVTPFAINELNYSITNVGGSDYYLNKNYILGLE